MQSDSKEAQTVLQGMLQYRGTLCGSLLTRWLFSAPTPAAILCAHKRMDKDEYNSEYTLVLGNLQLSLDPSLSVYPQIYDTGDEEKNIRLSRLCNQDDSLYIRAIDQRQHAEWLRAVRGAIADAAFQDAFRAPLQLNKIEKAIVDCATLVPNAHCHMRRAQKLVESLKILRRIVRTLEDDESGGEATVMMHRQDIVNFIDACSSEPVLRTSSDVELLRSLMEQKPVLAGRQRCQSDDAAVVDALRAVIAWPKIILESIEEDYDSCNTKSSWNFLTRLMAVFSSV